jgi:uncharacterized phage-associated protein
MSKTARERLPRKLEAVVARLCERLGAVNMTSAVKLPYLVDVVANQVLGSPITGGTHETWKLGVVTSEAWSYFKNNGDPNDPFVIREQNQFEGGKLISLAGEPDDELSPEEESVVDFVAESWGRLDADSLGRLTKSLNTQFDVSVWGKNLPALVDEDSYARLSPGWQAFCEKLHFLDPADESKWGEPIDDPRGYLRRHLGE